MSLEKLEENIFPILDLPYNIGICTNVVHIPTFDNLYPPPTIMLWANLQVNKNYSDV